ncbi:helix-turn-helix domain-containing protein [Spirosoma sordidisoli]|uniref:HTH cro/C1-type domain-containing protein n=1 Tax=Spirosoma sordidisoli TaxID=2502893 RepID=A0A4Q2UM09_9BACT|nr:helix-turn-helix domain-containing protein [Spirosoma sordidisoli]RYC69782.1 hypothetical protein EQG79_14400 [Spirosoma sordidisoli]
MEYRFKEKIEELLHEHHRTKKSLYDYLEMSMQGFDAMMKNNSFSAVRLAKVAEFFGVDVSELYGTTPTKQEIDSTFGGRILDKMARDIENLKVFYEEEIKVKNQQIAGLQRTVDVLVGKSEGAIVEPLSMDEFNAVFQAYMAAGLSSVQKRRIIPVNPSTAKLVAPR